MSSLRMLVPALILLATGCDGILGPGSGGGPPPTITELPRNLTASEEVAISASNAFGFELLHEVLEGSPESSVLMSPFSASMALGMALNGADGETFDAMRSTLGFDELPEGEINAAYRGLLDLLSGLDPSVEFATGNAVWHREDLTLRQDFRDRVGPSFRARMEGLDFSAPGATDVINAWADDATRGRIDQVIDPPIPTTVTAYLMNAVYFNAGWTRTFDPEDTWTGDFELPDGSTASVDFMSRKDSVPIHVSNLWVAADLPYGGEAWSMTVVVPHADLSVGEVVRSMTPARWEDMVDNFRVAEITVHLPRFELEWGGVLNDPLISLGMGAAFGDDADFTRMFENADAGFDEVMQRSFIRVDEEGTEAAAVTSSQMIRAPPPVFRANRPFLFLIRERLSGTILFMGAILDPPVIR